MSRFTMSEDEARTFLAAAREVTVAAVVEGRPLVRTMHAVSQAGGLVLHGAPQGEKTAWVGSEVVVSTEVVVARIPSHWRHPERACPATTWFRAVQLHGRIEELEEASDRALALQALMDHLQPEGGYRPIVVDDPLYTKTIAGLGMWRIVPDRLVGLNKLGQHLNRRSMNLVLSGLWKRGGEGDLAAIEVLRQAHAEPVQFTQLPVPGVPRSWPSESDLEASVELIRDTYWNLGFSDATLRGALRHGIWVGIEREDRLVAVARGMSDRHKRGWVYDVVVEPGLRGQGYGKALVALLLDHPHLRDVDVLHLGTRDAMGLYERFGFVAAFTRGHGDAARTLMVRDRRVTA
ncbi:MAG: GNAT family N-acetyltransferase [Myxococcota bacterium]